MKIFKTTLQHMYDIELQDKQYIPPEQLKSNQRLGEIINDMTFTYFDDSDKPIFIGGIYELHPRRFMMWALVGKYAGRYMTTITRRVKIAIQCYKGHRIEANVDPTFTNAIRWIEMLGFKNEGLMRGYGENGQDLYMYAILERKDG